MKIRCAGNANAIPKIKYDSPLPVCPPALQFYRLNWQYIINFNAVSALAAITCCNPGKFIIIAALNESLLQNIRFVHGIPAERLCERAIMIISPY